jgi:hypothetical protein
MHAWVFGSNSSCALHDRHALFMGINPPAGMLQKSSRVARISWAWFQDRSSFFSFLARGKLITCFRAEELGQ